MSPSRMVRNYLILMYNEHKKLKVVLDIICTSSIKIVGKMKVTQKIHPLIYFQLYLGFLLSKMPHIKTGKKIHLLASISSLHGIKAL